MPISSLLFLSLVNLLIAACSGSVTVSPIPTQPAPMLTVAAETPTTVALRPATVPVTAKITPTTAILATSPLAPLLSLSSTFEPSKTATSSAPIITPTLSLTPGAWRLGQPLIPLARSEMPAVTLGDWIYVPGGFGGESRLDRYNPVTDEWQALAPMPAGRHHLMALAYAGYLYILGGAQADSWTPTNTVWRYDPPINTWREVGVIPEPRLAGAAVILGDNIYVAGGVGGSEDLLEFNFNSGQWRSLPGPIQPREHVSAVAFQGELWVLGGRWVGVGELTTVEIFNPATETWRDGPSLNVARAGFAAAVVQQQVMVAGGEVIINGQETLASFEYLAPESDTWQLGPDLLYPMHGIGGAEFQGQFLLLGGSRQAGAIKNEGQVQIYEPR